MLPCLRWPSTQVAATAFQSSSSLGAVKEAIGKAAGISSNTTAFSKKKNQEGIRGSQMMSPHLIEISSQTTTYMLKRFSPGLHYNQKNYNPQEPPPCTCHLNIWHGP